MSSPLLKQGHLELIAQDCIQMTLEYLQEWRLCSLPGQPVPVLGHPLNNKVLMMFMRNLLYLCPLYLVLSLGTTAQACSLSSTPFLWILHTLV